MAIDIDKIWLYRLIHVDNVEYVLRNGMFTRNHAQADPSYINIGDTILINQRSEYPVKIEGYGNLGDYVRFYFGPLSPMLLNIKTGYRGITKRPQSDLVYVCCKLTTVIARCEKWCFTDGHAKDAITDFYNSTKDLNQVDWTMVKERYWNNNENDFDRMRRKQAEFLVYNHVPVSSIKVIIAYNEERTRHVEELTERLGLDIEVHFDKEHKFYY